jgi:hypothetical protein
MLPNTKTKILDLTKAHPALTSYDIADRLQCHPAYVRTIWHRAGIFRGKHNPNVDYDQGTGKYRRLPMAEYDKLVDGLKSERERWAEYADRVALNYEAGMRGHQVRIVPEPQLSKLKAQHWRIIANFIRTGKTG